MDSKENRQKKLWGSPIDDESCQLQSSEPNYTHLNAGITLKLSGRWVEAFGGNKDRIGTDQGMHTFSYSMSLTVPFSHSHTARGILHLTFFFQLFVFQLRNKPKEPPRVPKSAPFFLPTIAGLQPEFAIPADQAPEEVSHLLPGHCLWTEIGEKLVAALT